MAESRSRCSKWGTYSIGSDLIRIIIHMDSLHYFSYSILAIAITWFMSRIYQSKKKKNHVLSSKTQSCTCSPWHEAGSASLIIKMRSRASMVTTRQHVTLVQLLTTISLPLPTAIPYLRIISVWAVHHYLMATVADGHPPTLLPTLLILNSPMCTNFSHTPPHFMIP